MLDAFISYSRQNIEFVNLLANALEKEDKHVWFDQKRDPLEGIPTGSKWWNEIQYGISQSSNLLFIISSQSIVSPYCNAEIAHALQEDKRIVTLLYCENKTIKDTLNAINTAIDKIDPSIGIPEAVTADLDTLRSLVRRNWLAISQIQFVVAYSDDPIDRLTPQILGAIDLDIQWIRLWNDFRQAVQLWAENNKNDGYLWSEVRLQPLRKLADERNQNLDELQQEFALPGAKRLLFELEDIETTHDRRSEIGIRLNLIGDPRQGVGVIDGLPDIVWCYVAGGEVNIEDKTFRVQPFYIAQHIITYKQFQIFIEAPDGFDNAQWWLDIPERYVKQVMHNQSQQYINYPRDSVSWYQAVAYTRWVNHHFQAQSVTSINQSRHTLIIGASVEVRLPTEWEWQHAATDGNPENKYPWGDWQDGCSNTLESGISRTTAVGMYPKGQAGCGALDMTGNVWEWCLNDYKDFLINTNSQNFKALRGSGYGQNQTVNTCTQRHEYQPDGNSIGYGLRLVCGPVLKNEIRKKKPRHRQAARSRQSFLDRFNQ